jgi:hypothetical protein
MPRCQLDGGDNVSDRPIDGFLRLRLARTLKTSTAAEKVMAK